MPGPTPAIVGPATTDEFRPGGWNARYVGVIVVMLLMSELGFLQSAYPVNALPQIGAHFETSQVVWIPTIYFLVAALVSPIVGSLADKFGKKRILVIVLVLAILGLLMSTFAPNFGVLLFGRLLQAPVLTFPFLLPSLARDIFPTKTIPMAASLAVTGAGLLGVPSQFFSGPIIEHFGFRSVFWIPAIVAVVSLVLLLVIVPESDARRAAGPIDLVGAALLGGGITFALLGVSFGPTWGWASPGVLASFALGAVLLAAWIFQSRRVEQPLVELRDLSSRPMVLTMTFAGIGVAMSSWFFVFFPMVALAPADHGGLGLTPSHQTQVISLFALGSGLAGFLGGYLLRRLSGGAVAIIATAMMTAGWALGTFGAGSVIAYVVATLIIGICGALGLTVAYNMVIRLIRQERQAVTLSTFSLVFNVLASIASVALFAVMNGLGTPDAATGTIAYGSASFTAATAIPLALSALALGVAIALNVSLAGRDREAATAGIAE